MLSGDDATSLLAVAAKLCCVGIALQSAEFLSVGEELRDRGLLGWQRAVRAKAPVRRALQYSQAFPFCGLILAGRLVAALACLALPYGGILALCLLGVLTLAQLYYNRRFQLVFANSDHMTLIVLAAVTVACFPGASVRLKAAALGFLAFQCLLAYTAGGIDKISAGHWRTGRRLVYVFQDSAHRFPPLGRWLARHERIAVVLSLSIILWETLFVVGLFLPTPGFWLFVATGLLFHATIAILMALPGFFWAFAATYPGLYFVHLWVVRILYS